MFINDLFNDKDKPLNEVSNELLGRYKKAAGADATAADKRGDVEQGNKRFRGIVKATVKQGDNDAKRHKQQGVAEVQPAPTTTQPALTPAQTKKAQAVIDASGPAATQITQAGEKWQAGNKFGAAVDTAKAVNNVANAAGATFGDKLAVAGSAAKGAWNAGLAHLRGKNAGAAFAGSMASDLTQPVADYTNSKDFGPDFYNAMSAGGNPANPLQKAYDANLVNQDSVRTAVNSVNKTANQLKSGDASAMQNFEPPSLYRDDQTPYLDINKRNVITQQPVQTKAEIQADYPISGVKEEQGQRLQTTTPPPLNVPQGWEAKTQADGSTRISKQGSIPSDVYKQNIELYKKQNWTPEKITQHQDKMASGGYTAAERSANYQQQQKSFGQYADKPLDEQGMAEGIGRGEYSRVLTALGLYYPRLSMEELNVPGFHKVIANKADVPVEYAAQVINDFVKANEPDDDDDDEQEEYKDVSEARNGDTNFGSTVGHGSWVVYDGGKVKRFKSRDGAKAYAAKNGGKVASSEFYADKIQKQGVAEDKKPDNYHIVNKDGKPASLASYADRASAEKDRDAKHPGAEVRQVGPRGKVKGVSEGLPQTLRKVVPGYAKREIDKKMDAEKFGRTDVDRDANYYRYKKIQDKIKEQGVAEGFGRNRGYEPGFASPHAPSLGGRRDRDEPDAVNNIEISINGRVWKIFAGKGPDSSKEFFQQKQAVDSMCKRKTAETGKKWSWGVTGAAATNEGKCNMTEEGRACPEHDILECPGYSRLMGEAFKMPPESVQDRMHRKHQELRKKSGLPDPEHYLKLKKQKEQELAVLRAEIAADKEKGLTEERYLEELQRAGYDVITEKKTKQRLDPKCWTGYKKQGTKIKGGVRVNNCVPKK